MVLAAGAVSSRCTVKVCQACGKTCQIHLGCSWLFIKAAGCCCHKVGLNAYVCCILQAYSGPNPHVQPWQGTNNILNGSNTLPNKLGSWLVHGQNHIMLTRSQRLILERGIQALYTALDVHCTVTCKTEAKGIKVVESLSVDGDFFGNTRMCLFGNHELDQSPHSFCCSHLGKVGFDH